MSATIDTIRCSSLPEAFRCAGSVRHAEIRIDPYNEMAEIGTAAHELLAVVVDRDLDSSAGLDVEGTAKRYGVDPDDLGYLVRSGVYCWRQIRDSFKGAISEVELTAQIAPGITLTGHTDLLATNGTIGVLGDWKGGRVDRDYSEQLQGYNALTLINFPELTEVAGYVCWLREREVERHSMDRKQLAAWLERLLRDVIHWDGVFRPHDGCVYCQRSHECPALIAVAKRDVAILGDDSLAARIANGLSDFDAAEIVGLYRKVRQLTSFGESFVDATRRHVAHAGPLDSGDGKELKLVPTKRRIVDTLKAWPALQSRLDDTEMAKVLKVSLGDAEEIIGKKAGRGNGAEAKRQLAAELDLAEAVTVTASAQLREVRRIASAGGK